MGLHAYYSMEQCKVTHTRFIHLHVIDLPANTYECSPATCVDVGLLGWFLASNLATSLELHIVRKVILKRSWMGGLESANNCTTPDDLYPPSKRSSKHWAAIFVFVTLTYYEIHRVKSLPRYRILVHVKTVVPLAPG